MSLELEICPFCKASPEWIDIRRHDHGGDYYVECDFCGARGGENLSGSDAICQWNEISNTMLELGEIK